MALGLLLAAIGMDTVSGQLRMTFGFDPLLRGVNFLVAVIGLFGISEILLTMEERLALRGHAAAISSARRPEGVEGDAALLGDAAALVGDRLLARHHARRRDRGVVHGLQPRQALLEGSGDLRQGTHRRRVRAGDRRACLGDLGAAADAGARNSRLRHGGDPARRPDGVGPQSRSAAVRRAQGLRVGAHRLDVPRQRRRARDRADDGADLRRPSCAFRSPPSRR